MIVRPIGYLLLILSLLGMGLCIAWGVVEWQKPARLNPMQGYDSIIYLAVCSFVVMMFSALFLGISAVIQKLESINRQLAIRH